MKSQTIKCILSGLAAGAANGLFGAGGGLLLVPLLLRWVKLDRKQVFATSLAVMFPVCLISVGLEAVAGSFPWGAALPYAMGGALGGFLGGRVFHRIPERALHILLGALTVFGGVRSLL